MCELIGGTYLTLVEFVSLPTFFEAMARFFTTCPRSKLHCRSPTWRAFRAGAAYTAPELRLRTTRETTRRVENKEVNIGTWIWMLDAWENDLEEINSKDRIRATKVWWWMEASSGEPYQQSFLPLSHLGCNVCWKSLQDRFPQFSTTQQDYESVSMALDSSSQAIRSIRLRCNWVVTWSVTYCFRRMIVPRICGAVRDHFADESVIVGVIEKWCNEILHIYTSRRSVGFHSAAYQDKKLKILMRQTPWFTATTTSRAQASDSYQEVNHLQPCTGCLYPRLCFNNSLWYTGLRNAAVSRIELYNTTIGLPGNGA